MLSRDGSVVLFITPSEERYVSDFAAAGIELPKYEFPRRELDRAAQPFLRLVSEHYELHLLARAAYKSYLQTYAQNSKLDAKQIPLREAALAYGLTIPPRVDLNVK